MTRIPLSLAAFAMATLLAGGVASAQMAQPAKPAAPAAATTDKAAAKQKAAEAKAMKKQKETACAKQADDQKLKLLKRRSFIKDCVAKG